MRDRCQNLLFPPNFTYNMLQREVLEKKSLVFLLITNGIEKYWSRCATTVKKIISFSLNFTYTSLQDTVLEKICLVFLMITNSIKLFGRDARPL